MSEGLLDLPPIRFPLIGNSIVIGIFSLLHISLASLSIGFIVLAPLFEYLGLKDPFFTHLSKSLVQFTAVVFSVSATFAVIMLELFIGLFPIATVYLFRRFDTAVYLALAVFLLHLFCFYVYWYRWGKMRRKRPGAHILLGAAAALFALIWSGLLDQIGSYMLTPPTEEIASLDPKIPLARASSLVTMNPTWIPLVLHRFFGNLIVSCFAIACYGASALLRAKRRSEEDKRYYDRAVELGMMAGTAFLLIQPVAGILYTNRIGRANPQAMTRLLSGPDRWLLILQFLLVGLLFLLNNLFFYHLSDHPGRSRFITVMASAAAAVMVLTAQQVVLRRAATFLLIGITLSHFVFILLHRKPVPPGRAVRWLVVATGLCALFTFLLMGVIREQLRRPYTVYGQIRLEDETKPITEVVRK